MITRKTANTSDFDFQLGEILLYDKPINKTSFQAVYDVRKITKVKKVGHAGTLDPRATGVLIICTGKKTKEISSFQDMDKTYTGAFTLGFETASMDSETVPEHFKPFEHITLETMNEIKESFLGEIEQIPPMFSAVNHNGKKLYKLARKGITVERAPRLINVHEFEITEVNLPVVKFMIRCSKGTYIRVMAHDFGKKLGCGAYLSELRRTKIGEFSVDDAFSKEEFKNFYVGLATKDDIKAVSF